MTLHLLILEHRLFSLLRLLDLASVAFTLLDNTAVFFTKSVDVFFKGLNSLHVLLVLSRALDALLLKLVLHRLEMSLNGAFDFLE